MKIITLMDIDLRRTSTYSGELVGTLKTGSKIMKISPQTRTTPLTSKFLNLYFLIHSHLEPKIFMKSSRQLDANN